MTLSDRHMSMLRSIAQQPRESRYFTNNNYDALSPVACATYLNQMTEDGLIEINNNGLYEITEAGREILNRPQAEPRTFCNASIRQVYRSPVWSVRDGSDAALKIPSRGTRC